MTGTAVATREPKAQLTVGGEVAAIIPRSIEEMFRLAGAIHQSGLAPNTLKGPDQIMVAIMAGAELGLAPFQSLQSFAVINGRPSIWGDGLMAVVRSQGFAVKEWIEGEGDAMVARCEVTRPKTGEVTPGEFSVADAKKAGLWGKAGPWQSYPKRMLKMRARAFALRDGAADVLRGFQIREEVEDYQPIRDVTPKPSGVMARLEQHGGGGPGFSQAHVEAETGRPLGPEQIDAIIDGDRLPDAVESEIVVQPSDAPPADDEAFPGDVKRGSEVKTLSERATDFEAALVACKTQDERDKAWSRSSQLRSALDKGDPDRLAELEALMNRLSGSEG